MLAARAALTLSRWCVVIAMMSELTRRSDADVEQLAVRDAREEHSSRS